MCDTINNNNNNNNNKWIKDMRQKIERMQEDCDGGYPCIAGQSFFSKFSR